MTVRAVQPCCPHPGGQEVRVPPGPAGPGGDPGRGGVWPGGAGQGPGPHWQRLHQGGGEDAQVSLLGLRAAGPADRVQSPEGGGPPQRDQAPGRLHRQGGAHPAHHGVRRARESPVLPPPL